MIRYEIVGDNIPFEVTPLKGSYYFFIKFRNCAAKEVTRNIN